jgi:hypothetical protein
VTAAEYYISTYHLLTLAHIKNSLNHCQKAMGASELIVVER